MTTLIDRTDIGRDLTRRFADGIKTVDTVDVYLDGVVGSDNNSGLSSDKPVATWDRMVRILNEYTLVRHKITAHVAPALAALASSGQAINHTDGALIRRD